MDYYNYRMNKATNRGVLGSVQSVLYVYGQLKPNISVCEILNRNRSKWLETVGFDGISVSVGFGFPKRKSLRFSKP